MNSEELHIREFKPEEYDVIIGLWRRAGLTFRPQGRDRPERIKAQLKNGTTLLLVAEWNGKIVGTVLGTHDGRKGWINRLAVEIACRRMNIAGRLVAAAEAWFEAMGLDVFTCVIESDNTASVELFKKLGYDEWDVRYFSKSKSLES